MLTCCSRVQVVSRVILDILKTCASFCNLVTVYADDLMTAMGGDMFRKIEAVRSLLSLAAPAATVHALLRGCRTSGGTQISCLKRSARCEQAVLTVA